MNFKAAIACFWFSLLLRFLQTPEIRFYFVEVSRLTQASFYIIIFTPMQKKSQTTEQVENSLE